MPCCGCRLADASPARRNIHTLVACSCTPVTEVSPAIFTRPRGDLRSKRLLSEFSANEAIHRERQVSPQL